MRKIQYSALMDLKSFCEHSFREQCSKTLIVSASTRYMSRGKKLVLWNSFREQKQKTRFVCNFTSIVSKSAHVTREHRILIIILEKKKSLKLIYSRVFYSFREQEGKTRFVSNFNRFVSKSAHETRKRRTLRKMKNLIPIPAPKDFREYV